jgi:hypothetical protein
MVHHQAQDEALLSDPTRHFETPVRLDPEVLILRRLWALQDEPPEHEAVSPVMALALQPRLETVEIQRSMTEHGATGLQDRLDVCASLGKAPCSSEFFCSGR